MENQYEFTSGKSTTDAIYTTRILIQRQEGRFISGFHISRKSVKLSPWTSTMASTSITKIPERYISEYVRRHLRKSTLPCWNNWGILCEVWVWSGISTESPSNFMINYLTVDIHPTPWNIFYTDNVILTGENLQTTLENWKPFRKFRAKDKQR